MNDAARRRAGRERPVEGTASRHRNGNVGIASAPSRPVVVSVDGRSLGSLPVSNVERVIESAVALAILLATAPAALLLAGAIKLEDSRSPVLFRQERTGLGGRRFRMFKFRTMVPDAESMKSTLAEYNRLDWPDFKAADDPRVTVVGRFARRFALDELPNLLNVVLGDMALVGPRPTSFPVEHYEPWQVTRLGARPGVTGLWQVSRERDEGFDARVRIDLDYLARRTPWMDLGILLRTVPAVIRRRAAY